MGRWFMLLKLLFIEFCRSVGVLAAVFIVGFGFTLFKLVFVDFGTRGLSWVFIVVGGVVRFGFVSFMLPEGFGARGLLRVFVAVGGIVKFEFISSK